MTSFSRTVWRVACVSIKSAGAVDTILLIDRNIP